MPVWGAPLRKGLRLARATRSPRSLTRFGARFGLQKLLTLLGLSSIAFPLVSLIFPMIQGFVQQAINKRMEFEEARMNRELWKLRVDILQTDMKESWRNFREDYRSHVP